MATDYSQFQVGGVLEPLSTTSTNSLLQDADPSLFFFTDFLAYVINTYPGPRLVQALQAANVMMPNRQFCSQAVAQVYPYQPLPEQLELQFNFPLLAVYHTDIKTEWHSVGYEFDIFNLEMLYVLPPLDAAATEQIVPILKAIASDVRRKFTDAWDPGYTPPGGALGAQWTSAAVANVSEAGFGEYQGNTKNIQKLGNIGFLENAGGLFFPCLKMNAYIVERDEPNPTPGGPSKFAGADITLNLQADDGAIVPSVVQVSTNPVPTIASLSVTTGSAAGGTSTTITGTGFLSGPPLVYFGPSTNPQYAASVTYGSSTSLTVTTPAMQGAGTVDVTVTNRDGQSVTLPQSFTFT